MGVVAAQFWRGTGLRAILSATPHGNPRPLTWFQTVGGDVLSRRDENQEPEPVYTSNSSTLVQPEEVQLHLGTLKGIGVPYLYNWCASNRKSQYPDPMVDRTCLRTSPQIKLADVSNCAPSREWHLDFVQSKDNIADCARELSA